MAAVQQDPAADQFYWCPSRTPFLLWCTSSQDINKLLEFEGGIKSFYFQFLSSFIRAF